MGSVNGDEQRQISQTALVPLAEAMPELRADQYAKVREWDAARMALEGEYEAADGEYLSKIRDALAPIHGLWTAYLRIRNIPVSTAGDRIRRAEGRFVASPRVKLPESGSLYKPQSLPAPTSTPEIIYDNEPEDAAWADAADDDDWPPHDASLDEPQAPTPSNWQPVPMPLMSISTMRDEEQAATEASVSSIPSVTTYSVETWEELHPDARLSIIGEGREGKAGLNKQSSDNIEWALWSWNPVTGCLHECPYCYARDIANRFYPQGFKPTFHPFRLGAPFHQAVPAEAEHELGHRNIFTCSMADLFGKWVPREWIQAVLDVVADAPQWNFLFLTKFPKRLAEFEYPPNAWLGTSVDCQARVKNAEQAFARVKGGVKWLSIEPMLEPIQFTSLAMFDWVVIGGASASSQTPEWHPPRRWVDALEAQARDAGCMVYEKTNLQARLREYPGWERAEPRLPDALKYLPSISQE